MHFIKKNTLINYQIKGAGQTRLWFVPTSRLIEYVQIQPRYSMKNCQTHSVEHKHHQSHVIPVSPHESDFQYPTRQNLDEADEERLRLRYQVYHRKH